MFTICPELKAGMLIMQSMKDTEAIVISGFEKFCNYDGYSRSFKYKGDYFEQEGAKKNYIVAIDALDYFCQDISNKFKKSKMLREITRAYTDFSKFSSLLIITSNNSYPCTTVRHR